MLPAYVPDWGNANSTLIKKRETELRVDFLSSGGQIYVYGSDRPELMRGPNPMGVVLDEYAVMRPEVWEEIIQPVMRSNPNGWCWFLFTPRGKNHAFKAFQFGQENKNDEWKSWKLTVEESGIYTPTQIANARSTMTAATFSQELMCEFLEGEGAVFRSVRDVCTAEPKKPVQGRLYVMGVDLAKVQDYTVLSIFDRLTNAQVYQERFQTLEWPYQKAKIKAISEHYNHALIILDATGIGDPIADDLLRAGLAVEPFKITEQTKKDLIEKLSIWIEQRKFTMINLQETLFEFDNFTYEVGPTGRIRYGAPQGYNDDIVIAIALAVWSLQPIQKKMEKGEPSLIRLEYLKQTGKIKEDSYAKFEREWAES